MDSISTTRSGLLEYDAPAAERVGLALLFSNVLAKEPDFFGADAQPTPPGATALLPAPSPPSPTLGTFVREIRPWQWALAAAIVGVGLGWAVAVVGWKSAAFGAAAAV